jgi:hypothetical protein
MCVARVVREDTRRFDLNHADAQSASAPPVAECENCVRRRLRLFRPWPEEQLGRDGLDA